jgi:hypothetical protein
MSFLGIATPVPSAERSTGSLSFVASREAEAGQRSRSSTIVVFTIGRPTRLRDIANGAARAKVVVQVNEGARKVLSVFKRQRCYWSGGLFLNRAGNFFDFAVAPMVA